MTEEIVNMKKSIFTLSSVPPKNPVSYFLSAAAALIASIVFRIPSLIWGG